MLGPPFGALLRALRDAAGLTQEELAERAGLTAHGISALERGARTRPYPHTVRSLAAALGASEEDLTALLTAAKRRAAPATDAPAGLPRHLDPVIGRDQDVARVLALLADGARLVTLTGLGGVGKTRLATAVAEAAGGEVRVVALAEVLEARLVRDAVDVESLVDRDVLLVLDNLEHLKGVADVVTGVLHELPRVAVLATSRHALGAPGEREHPVGPLALPPLPSTRLADVLDSPAGRLLVSRAQAVQPAFGTTDADAPALAEACHRLGGIPLALELAAARARVLGPAALLARLDSVLEATRAETLQSALRWSYGQLGGDAQALLRRLSVLVGGFDVDAAEAVAGDVVAPLDALDELVQHALVTGPSSGAAWRFGVLEPVRQLADGLLTGAERHSARQAAATHFLDLVEEGAPRVFSADQLAWMDRLELDLPNVDAAVEHLLTTGQDELAGRAVWSAWVFWWLHGHLRRGKELTAAAASRPLPPRLASLAASAAAEMAFTLGELEEAQQWADRAEQTGRESGDAFAASMGISVQALVAIATDRPADAHRLFEHALLVLPDDGDYWSAWLRSIDRIWLGNAARSLGDPEAALASIESGLQACLDRGDRVIAFTGYTAKVRALAALGDLDSAREVLDRAAETMKDVGEDGNYANLLSWVAAEVGLADETPEEDPFQASGSASRIRIYARRAPQR